MFYIVSTSASFRGLNLSQKGIHTFYLAGMTLIFYGSAIFESPVRTVQDELYNGTLEFVYSTPTNRYAYYVGAIIGKQILFTTFYIPAFVILLLVADIETINIAFMVGVSMLFILSIISLGVLVAMAAVLWKNVNSITAIIVTLINFVAGGFLPVSTLPTFGRYIAYLLPFTWGLDLVRYYAFNRNWDTLLPIEYELIILGINALFYGFLSILLLGKTEKYSKKKGLHLI
jgi:ABC-2 type transport system permease protein